jgi:hypothetical protein
MKGKTSNAEPWFTVSVDGLKKTLARKGKSVALYELAQNAMDTDATRIDIGLTPIENGVSILTCVDNSSSGFAQLNLAHEMYRESAKKSNPTLRGKFNLGEKFVVALCNESSITSMTGQITFRRDRTRIIGTEKTKQGTRFQGELPISLEDYEEVCNRARLLIPPQGQVITFNGEPLTGQELVKSFFITLPTEIADDEGILRPTKRKTTIRLYKVKDGEQPWLYEMGIPVVNMLDDMTYHVDVDQKVPSNTERDNVSPAYMKQVYTAVLNQTHEEITNGTAAWVSTALESTSIAPEATKAVIKARFGEKAVAYDKKDLGAENEAKSHGHTVESVGQHQSRRRLAKGERGERRGV